MYGADFLLEVSVDGGATYGSVLGPFNMTNSGGTSNPAPGNRDQGFITHGTLASTDPLNLASTVTTSFTTTGADVVIRFIPVTDTAVHRQIWAINGFELVKAN